MANEPGLEIEFTPRSKNTGANLLSRSLYGKGPEELPRPDPVAVQVFVWDEI